MTCVEIGNRSLCCDLDHMEAVKGHVKFLKTVCVSPN